MPDFFLNKARVKRRMGKNPENTTERQDSMSYNYCYDLVVSKFGIITTHNHILPLFGKLPISK